MTIARVWLTASAALSTAGAALLAGRVGAGVACAAWSVVSGALALDAASDRPGR